MKDPFGTIDYPSVSKSMKIVSAYLPLSIAEKLTLRATVERISLSQTAAQVITKDMEVDDYSMEEMIDILVDKTVNNWEHQKKLHSWGFHDEGGTRYMEEEKEKYIQTIKKSLGKRGLADNIIKKIIYKTGIQ